jgi:hypothetical protein
LETIEKTPVVVELRASFPLRYRRPMLRGDAGTAEGWPGKWG